MKILTVIGARPQFIKASAVSFTFKKYKVIEEVIIHTGQHYDKDMSHIFFQELKIPEPKYNLNLGGLSHGAMTGRMIEKIEKIILIEKPDILLVYGDTNSTLAGALAAKKIHVRVAHVEAGLRSYNQEMPEEINRILTDKLSDFLFCPTQTSVKNLENEGFLNSNCKIVNSGDVMFDAVCLFEKKHKKPLVDLEDNYILSTIHRAENTDNIERLRQIIEALNEISETRQVILPIHPRTRQKINENQLKVSSKIKITSPVSYFEMLFLIKNSVLVMTDSGGLQKEAFFLKKPCLTLRDQTEWMELVDNGYNILVGSSKEKIIHSYSKMINKDLDFEKRYYGNGYAADLIAQNLINF